MRIHPVIMSLSDDEISSFIDFLYVAPSYESHCLMRDASFPLKDLFFEVLGFDVRHEARQYDFKNVLDVKHLNDLEISSRSRLVDDFQQIVRYSVSGRLFALNNGMRYLRGSKGKLLHFKHLDLYVMIAGNLSKPSSTYISNCRKILSCYYCLTEDLDCKNTGKLYFVDLI